MFLLHMKSQHVEISGAHFLCNRLAVFKYYIIVDNTGIFIVAIIHNGMAHRLDALFARFPVIGFADFYQRGYVPYDCAVDIQYRIGRLQFHQMGLYHNLLLVLILLVDFCLQS